MMDSLTGVGVLDKAVLVLRCAAAAPCTLGELQARTGLPRATAHRLAVALEQHRLLRRDAAGRFDLGLELIALGRTASDRLSIVAVARPRLEALRDATGESVQLFVAESGGRRCVASLQSPHALRWIVPEGALLPLDVGSAGRVLCGESGPQGWVESVEEREPGVASVSAAVVDAGGRIVAAVSISGPIERLTRSPGTRFGRAALAAARQISDALSAVDPRTL